MELLSRCMVSTRIDWVLYILFNKKLTKTRFDFFNISSTVTDTRRQEDPNETDWVLAYGKHAGV